MAKATRTIKSRRKKSNIANSQDRVLIVNCIEAAAEFAAFKAAMFADPSGSDNYARKIAYAHHERAEARMPKITLTHAKTLLGVIAKARLAPALLFEGGGHDGFFNVFVSDVMRVVGKSEL